VVTLSATSPHPTLSATRGARRTSSSFLSKVLASVTAARQKRAERDIAEILHRQGGVMSSRGVVGRSYPFHSLPAVSSR
jgi:hypothetical protein